VSVIEKNNKNFRKLRESYDTLFSFHLPIANMRDAENPTIQETKQVRIAVKN